MATFKAIIKKEKMRSDKTWNGVNVKLGGIRVKNAIFGV